jgi:hypothetical protein
MRRDIDGSPFRERGASARSTRADGDADAHEREDHREEPGEHGPHANMLTAAQSRPGEQAYAVVKASDVMIGKD